MAGISMYEHQNKALPNMKNGCILCGGVGSGKSRTAIAYYYINNGGKVNTNSYVKMNKSIQDLYIITTARKRDTCEWEGELAPFLMSTDEKSNYYKNKIVIDSWNNIKKYSEVKNAFFIFDEQRVVGYGAWAKAFLKIAKFNDWILLSATPGDTWSDYIPVFIANGFYKNKTEFVQEHIVYDHRVKFPRVDRYLNTGRLIRLRNKILITMDFDRSTVSHHENIIVDYNHIIYKDTMKNRWDPYENKPFKNAAELCYTLRKIVNSDISRQEAVVDLYGKHPKLIIFYSFDYELNILKSIDYGKDVSVAEWNGHKHQPIPDTQKWVYLVQYTSGCEGWNCIVTDTIVFYSQNYSYKVMTQAAGRIDRLNTPYRDLYYYHLRSCSGIDLAIAKALSEKKKFNAINYIKKW